ETAETFYRDLQAHRIASVSVDRENRVYANVVDGDVYSPALQYTEPLDEALEAEGVGVDWRAEPEDDGLGRMLIYAIVALIAGGAFLFWVRRARALGTTTIFALRKTTARLVSDVPKVGWAD